jgi:hypothetical protein
MEVWPTRRSKTTTPIKSSVAIVGPQFSTAERGAKIIKTTSATT